MQAGYSSDRGRDVSYCAPTSAGQPQGPSEHTLCRGGSGVTDETHQPCTWSGLPGRFHGRPRNNVVYSQSARLPHSHIRPKASKTFCPPSSPSFCVCIAFILGANTRVTLATRDTLLRCGTRSPPILLKSARGIQGEVGSLSVRNGKGADRRTRDLSFDRRGA